MDEVVGGGHARDIDVNERNELAVGHDALAVRVADFHKELAEVAAGGSADGLFYERTACTVLELGGLGSDQFGGTPAARPLDLGESAGAGADGARDE